MITDTLKMLGHKGRCRVTNFEGVITSVSFDLYGCVQAVLQPPAKDGKTQEGHWFDVKRIEVAESVMDPPKFEQTESGEESGPAEKPLP